MFWPFITGIADMKGVQRSGIIAPHTFWICDSSEMSAFMKVGVQKTINATPMAFSVNHITIIGGTITTFTTHTNMVKS